MKSILVFVNSIAPAGGIERVVANLVNNWCKMYKVTILVKDQGDSFYSIDEKIKIESLDIPLFLNMHSTIQRATSLAWNLVKTELKLKRYLSKVAYDYIYVASPLNALEIFLLGKSFRRKLVISEHGSKFGYNKVYQFIKKVVYPKAYKISVPTTTDTQLYVNEGCKAIYIPHISTFAAEQKNKLDTKLVINIGRLTADKQQHLLLKVWHDLYKNKLLNGWKLQIIGKGEEEENLRYFIKDNEMQNVVEITEPIRNVELVYKRASVFAFTSRFEGFGMVLLEAMSYGIPCISFDCPSGPRDIIKSGRNGFLIPCFDLDKYKKELLRLINNEDNILESYGDKAFETVTNWNNQDILTKWDEVFK